MKKKIIIAMVTLFLSVHTYGSDLLIDNVKRSDKVGVIVLFDRSGLNNYLSCKSLASKNISQHNNHITKKALRKIKASSVDYYVFDEQINSIGKVESTRAGKLYRGSKELMQNVEIELKKDTSSKGKDVISTFTFLNNLVSQNYQNYTHIVAVMLSNLRDTLHTVEQRKGLDPIVLDKKITLKIFASSGLECREATSSQIQNANKSIVDYYSTKLKGSVSISTIY